MIVVDAYCDCDQCDRYNMYFSLFPLAWLSSLLRLEFFFSCLDILVDAFLILFGDDDSWSFYWLVRAWSFFLMDASRSWLVMLAFEFFVGWLQPKVLRWHILTYEHELIIILFEMCIKNFCSWICMLSYSWLARCFDPWILTIISSMPRVVCIIAFELS